MQILFPDSSFMCVKNNPVDTSLTSAIFQILLHQIDSVNPTRTLGTERYQTAVPNVYVYNRGHDSHKFLDYDGTGI